MKTILIFLLIAIPTKIDIEHNQLKAGLINKTVFATNIPKMVLVEPSMVKIATQVQQELPPIKSSFARSYKNEFSWYQPGCT